MDFDNLEKKAKELWDNPKSKALLKLVIYLVIVIFAIAVGRKNISENKDIVSSKPILSNSEIMENYKKVDSYKATYIIDGKEYIYTKVNKELLKIDNDTFEIVDNNVTNLEYQNLEIPEFDFKFWLLKPTYLSNLTLFSDEDSTYIKKYTSGETKIGYEIDLANFITTFDEGNLDIESTKNVDGKIINLEFKLKDNHVISAELDLKSYFELTNSKNKDGLVKIAYYYE